VSFKQFLTWLHLRDWGREADVVGTGWMDGWSVDREHTPFTLVWMLAMYEPSTCIYIPGSHQVTYLLTYLHSNHLHSLPI
jgi:hypothetical protein